MSWTCSNCGTACTDAFCSHCGQKRFEFRRPLRELLGEFASELFSFDSRMVRSLMLLFFYPGYLTRHYCEGHRAEFTSPVRLYLFSSFILFFGIPWLVGANEPPKKWYANIGTLSAQLEKNSEVRSGQGELAAKDLDTWEIEAKKKKAEKRDSRIREIREGTFKGTWTADFLERLTVLDSLPKKDQDIVIDHAKSFFFEMFPKVMFVLMPLFAGVLTLLFIRRGRFYVEHLVFALHVHSAIYLALLPGALLGGFSTIIFGCVVFWQMYFGMLHVYGQGGFKTFLKFVVLVASYGATAMMCAGYVFIYALMN